MRISVDLEPGESPVALQEFLRRTEAAYLRFLVERVGHRGEAAVILGISRKNLWEKLRRLGLGDLPTRAISLISDAKARGVPVDEMREALTKSLLGPSKFAA